MKAAWYCHGVNILTGTTPEFVWAFIEDSKPFALNLIQCNRETLRVGAHKCKEVWGKVVNGLVHNNWTPAQKGLHYGGLTDREIDLYAEIM
jgi:hypothetical protein